MSNVTHLHGLTTAHRCLMARIQDICVDITLYTPDAAACHYSGCNHSLEVYIIPRLHQAEDQGGDGSFRAEQRKSVYLPPSPLATADSLKALSTMLNDLADRLPKPGPGPGGAA